ncbi:MAG TPA: hypothetical protein VFQ35_09340 [Polyangiaceae bacterium]|nr:hypothetical protein [Polyangiaceae bacterium]
MLNIKVSANQPPWPKLRVVIDSNELASAEIRTRKPALYEFSLEGDGAAHTISLSNLGSSNAPGSSLQITQIEFMDCTDLAGTCRDGGIYHRLDDYCSPLICDSPSDCGSEFPGPRFSGTCESGRCLYPSCVNQPNAADTTVHCFSRQELAYILTNPHGFFVNACPTVDSLTWGFRPVVGEGSCAEAPVCGPNSPADFGFPGNAGECCYGIARVCGV